MKEEIKTDTVKVAKMQEAQGTDILKKKMRQKKVKIINGKTTRKKQMGQRKSRWEGQR